jgi:hypothetical protein
MIGSWPRRGFIARSRPNSPSAFCGRIGTLPAEQSATPETHLQTRCCQWTYTRVVGNLNSLRKIALEVTTKDTSIPCGLKSLPRISAFGEGNHFSYSSHGLRIWPTPNGSTVRAGLPFTMRISTIFSVSTCLPISSSNPATARFVAASITSPDDR